MHTPQPSMCGPLEKFLVLRHAAACFYLHMRVPTHLWEIELTNKRHHGQHCWAELITFTIRIVCSGFVDIHHSQMAQTVVAHMQTVLCLDVAHHTERSLNMASRAWSSEEQADRHTKPKNWMLRHAAACFQTPMCSSKKRVLQHAAACCGCTCAIFQCLAEYEQLAQLFILRECIRPSCCARRGRDTHPRIPVTYLVARRSSKAHMRTTKLPSTWYSTVPMNNPLRLVGGVVARCVHGARTVQCFWNMHPASTPLNSSHKTTPRVPISAPCSPCSHTRNFYFLF